MCDGFGVWVVLQAPLYTLWSKLVFLLLIWTGTKAKLLDLDTPQANQKLIIAIVFGFFRKIQPLPYHQVQPTS